MIDDSDCFINVIVDLLLCLRFKRIPKEYIGILEIQPGIIYPNQLSTLISI